MATRALETADETPNRRPVVGSHRRLRQANRNLHEFLAMLGHELRTPLAAIRNALHVLHLKGDDAATRDWAHGIMERQTASMAHLVEDMLEITLIEHGKIKLRKQTHDLAQSIAQAIETVRPALDRRQHRLDVDLPTEPVLVDADPCRLEQIFTNLLNNAIKYMEPGGHIWVRARAHTGRAVVRFRDAGPGIGPDMLPHIFDPFWQLERTFDDSHNGVGIGLGLVRKLAELHGGSAHARSAGLGFGSEFVIRLPVLARNLQASM